MNKITIHFTILAIAFGLLSCDGTTTETTTNGLDSTIITIEKNNENELSKNGITLTPVLNSPNFDEAIIEMNSPSETDELSEGVVNFSFNVKNYELGAQTNDAPQKMCANSGKGQHIHLMLNNEPYTAHYEAEIQQELVSGNYTVLSFISRSYHESIKHPQAYVLRNIKVGNVEDDAVDLTQPLMFYSRPKGEYFGDEVKNVMLDFYLVNTDLSENGNKVIATVNGTVFELNKWVPYMISGLPLGENKIKLELVDSEGKRIENKFNPVERTFILSNLN